ncbi:hypothetical protein HK103_005265 [Boothiomyces macroporosus]|uniref:Uncharacterized protein n=1 Tax=Boothiomyces macroporosus TaxID=261099 RepID=A0AAD5Y7J7_9FUNG|nr:hypothetical protein HK103_005245 [Boothiomyces macroporosus]KAJ3256631.1 hypothetical protein HK103_005265 [Boothiomyces macroporosus]
MKFTIIFSIALIFAAPAPKPDIEEMLLAHTNPLEFANVHTIGLLDMDLLLAAHTPSSPNPPNSMASELNKDAGKLVNGISAVEGGSSSECTSSSCCDSSCSTQKRAVNLQSLFNGPPKNGQLNAAGLAAANRAKNMLQDMVKKHPNNLKLKDGLTQMNDFLAKQKHQVCKIKHFQRDLLEFYPLFLRVGASDILIYSLAIVHRTLEGDFSY